MSTVEEVKAALAKLTLEERAEILSELCGWTDDDWDRQMKADAAAGKFAALNRETDETNATLEISGASGPQAGAYDVLVTGPDGTVVSDKASVLVTVFDVRPVVSLLGAAGTGFRVDYTDDLDGGPWLLLTNGVLSVERQEVLDFTSTNRGRRFYRTVVEP